jgi:hypothetical protein
MNDLWVLRRDLGDYNNLFGCMDCSRLKRAEEDSRVDCCGGLWAWSMIASNAFTVGIKVFHEKRAGLWWAPGEGSMLLCNAL